MNDRKVLLDCYNWNSTDDICREDKVRLYNSQENTYTSAIYCGFNYPFINIEGEKYYMLGRWRK